MNENRTIHLVEVPIGGKDGFVWNRLHGERENICETLLKRFDPLADERRELLQSRLRKVDDALDRLMSGSYGNCSKCGQAIDDAKLDIDPALALCLDCWAVEPSSQTSSFDNSEIRMPSLKPFDTIMVRTHNTDYRILLLDPPLGRALVEGGAYLAEPSEALVRGSAAPGNAFKVGTISTGGRLEMWINDRVVLTSIIESVQVKHSLDAESVADVSAALH